MHTFVRLYTDIMKHFDLKQKKQAMLVFGMILFSTVFELLCVPVVLPLVNLATTPNAIQENQVLRIAGAVLGLTEQIQYIVFALILIIIVYVAKCASTVLLYKVQYHFIYSNQWDLASRLVNYYAHQPYMFHKEKNVSSIQRDISTDVVNYYTVVLTLAQFTTEIVVCFALFSYLLVSDLVVTIFTVLLLGGFLGCFMLAYKRRLSLLGSYARDGQARTTKWLLQIFGAIKEIKAAGCEKAFLNIYDRENKNYTNVLEQQQILTNLPRPVMEASAIVVLLTTLLVRLLVYGETGQVIASLSVFAVAAFRLLPSFNRIAGYITTLTFYKASVDAVHRHLELGKTEEFVPAEKHDSLQFKHQIEIRELHFQYADATAPVLQNVNITIPKNHAVAFIGPSGSGKSTMADLILGLLRPQKGGIYVDEVNIEDIPNQWHNLIGYIPQTIYLLDDTVRANVAFGVPDNEISDEAVWEALRQAQLEEFVRGLESGLDTIVGEQGAKLSGGQRQRIGIARALYRHSEILILDEATSALDGDTENAVMAAIENLQGSKTLVVIAHRLTTIQNCDCIYKVQDGHVCLQERGK